MSIIHSYCCIKALRLLEHDSCITHKQLSQKYPFCSNEIVEKLYTHKAIHFSTIGHTIVKSRFQEVLNEYKKEIINKIWNVIKYLIPILLTGGGIVYCSFRQNITINQQNNNIQNNVQQHYEIHNN